MSEHTVELQQKYADSCLTVHETYIRESSLETLFRITAWALYKMRVWPFSSRYSRRTSRGRPWFDRFGQPSPGHSQYPLHIVSTAIPSAVKGTVNILYIHYWTNRRTATNFMREVVWLFTKPTSGNPHRELRFVIWCEDCTKCGYDLWVVRIAAEGHEGAYGFGRLRQLPSGHPQYLLLSMSTPISSAVKATVNIVYLHFWTSSRAASNFCGKSFDCWRNLSGSPHGVLSFVI